MMLSRSTSSVIILGLLQTLAQTPTVGGVPHDARSDLSNLSNRASIESIENSAVDVLQRVWKGISCLGDCRVHWGWTGKHFGSDPWGPVVLKGDPEPYSNSESNAGGAGGSNSSQSVGAGSYNTAANGGTGGVTTTAPTSTVVFSVYNVPTLSTTSTSSSQEPTPTPPPETTSNPPEQPVTTPVDNGNQGVQDQNQGSNNSNQGDSNQNGNSNSGGSNNGVAPNTGSDGSVSGDDQFQYLQQHNNFRAQHGAGALTWSDQLAGFAQEWANNCQFQHSGGKFGRIGENLAAGTGSYGIPEMVGDWTSEVSNYDPNNPQASHFTQVVWKGTTQVGCAKATCGGIFSEGGSATFYVCEYSPAGNVVGQFAQNVQK